MRDEGMHEGMKVTKLNLIQIHEGLVFCINLY